VAKFDAYMNTYQVAWRRTHALPEGEGWQNGKQRPWILPKQHWQYGLWLGIRRGSAYALPDYLQRNRIQKHQGVHNLKSSWMLCANLYFPFGATEDSRNLLAGFLREYVSPEIQSVDSIELEYAEPTDSPLHPSSLLGEQGGSRGTGQTSPDVAFHINNGQGLVLVENKFVEHSFYTCSARRRNGSDARPGNPDPSRCNETSALPDNFETLCHQTVWGRRYWEHLAPVIDQEVVASLPCCPAAKAGYQLFRQHALAEGIAASGKYNQVISCVALDARNETVRRCLRTTGIPKVRQWGELFHGQAQFAVFTHQQWVAWVHTHGGGQWTDWLHYVQERYEYNV